MCATNLDDPNAYKGLLDGLYLISKYEGIRGLYRGMIPAFFGVSHGALQFMAYEEMKKWKLKDSSGKDREKLVSLYMCIYIYIYIYLYICISYIKNKYKHIFSLFIIL